jgi:hypothetical protein
MKSYKGLMENIPYPGHKSFLEGREQVEDEPLVRSDRRLTLRMISSELNLNRFTVHQILTRDLAMRKVYIM